MTDRIRLDDLTSDALDALYEQLEAAEQTESQRQLATAREALASATTRAARAEGALDRVRAALTPYDKPVYGDTSRGMQIGWDRARQAVLAALDEPAPGTDGLHARHVNVDLHNVCEYSVNRAALCLVDFIRAEFPGVHVTTDAREWDERAPDPGAGAATQATAPAAWGPSAGRPGS